MAKTSEVKKSETPTSALTKARLHAAERRLGYKFNDVNLLGQAFCHASTRNEGLPSNERLEFLGDSILNLLVSWFLYDGLSDADEGTLSHRRALITQGPHLTKVATNLKLGELLRTGRGQDLEPTPSMLADVVEACIGAIFIDGGLQAAQDFVLAHVIANYKPEEQTYQDPKSRLQHYTLEKKLGLPQYKLIETSGPGHSLSFTMEVLIAGEQRGSGRGSSKKIAAQLAADKALSILTGAYEGNEKVAKDRRSKNSKKKNTNKKKITNKRKMQSKKQPSKKTRKKKKKS